MYIFIIYPLLIIILIFIQGFFANSEMAMVSSSRIHLQYLANSGNKKAKIILGLLNNPDRLFGTTLLVINLAAVASTIIIDYFFHLIHENLYAVTSIIPLNLFIILIMEPVILLFGELFPMSMARKYPNTTALRNAGFIRVAYFLMYPFMLVLSNISKSIGKLFKFTKNNILTREELQLIVAGRFSKLDYKTKEYIREVFNINQLVASDIMVHLDKVTAVNEDATVGDVKEIIDKSNHSRIPVFKNDIFNIVSTIHAVNILGADDKEKINVYTEKLYIIPSTKPIIEILKELKGNRKYMGIVVDEYGAVSGIITLKDILKEIIGDINDEFDEVESKEEVIDESVFDAQMRLDDFFDKTGIDFRDKDSDTLGGIINLAKGRIARVNEKIVFEGVHFEVLEATDRVVKKVRLLEVKK